MDFDKVISERHSARGFKGTKKPDYRAVIKAIDAANKAPLAGNIATFKYLVISDKVKNALSIPDSIEVEALLPVGYELHKDKQKRKPNLNNNPIQQLESFWLVI